MNQDNHGSLTLTSPPAWEIFGQWVIYGIALATTVGVLYMLYKMLFPAKDKSDET